MLALFSSSIDNESESGRLPRRQRVRCTIILTPTGDFTSLNICKSSKDPALVLVNPFCLAMHLQTFDLVYKLQYSFGTNHSTETIPIK